MSDPDRLDRIEKLIESNARSIEALSANMAETERDRARFYQSMADLSQEMANLAQADADTKQQMANLAREMAYLAQVNAETKREMYQLISNQDQRQNELSRRQGEIVEILKLITQQNRNA